MPNRLKEFWERFKRKKSYEELTADLEYRDRKADVAWKERYYGLRIIWTFLTILLLAFTLGFTYWLVKSVGTGALNFEKYTSFLDIVAVDIIINVLGLVAIVLKFLFPSNNKGGSPSNTVSEQ